MELLKPKRLREGDTLRIIAPSSSMTLSEKAVQTGVDNLEKLGFNVEIHPDVYTSYKGRAGTPEERAQSLMDGFMDDSVDGLMCCWGGFNSNDLLEHLDYDLIRDNPKAFIGYSDITILNTVLYQKAGVVNFHGPAFVTFTHEFLMDWEVEVFRKVVMEGATPYKIGPAPTFVDDPFYWKHPDTPVKEQENPGWDTVQEGTAKGKLIGGHFGTLLCLAGTEYWPDLKDHLLFVEWDEEDIGPVNVIRQLRHLKQLGALDEISGLLVGRIPEVMGLKGELSIESLLVDIVDRDIPVVTQMDFGHTNPIATFPVGIAAEISTEKNTLTLLEAGVR